MNVFLWNLLLALIWTAMSGQFTLTNLLVGLVIGYGSLFLAQPVSGPSPYFMKVYRIAAFFQMLQRSRSPASRPWPGCWGADPNLGRNMG
jgi:multicomponent Na+:H+ antiporter subunit E